MAERMNRRELQSQYGSALTRLHRERAELDAYGRLFEQYIADHNLAEGSRQYDALRRMTGVALAARRTVMRLQAKCDTQ